MEAKYTVVHAKGCNTNLGIIGATCNCGAETQAKISFKAGEQQGIEKGKKIAVEFIESYLVTTVHPEGDMHHIDDKEWQLVKLKLLRQASLKK